jgi:putative inorganic carbon (HCO3(-)) transporter
VTGTSAAGTANSRRIAKPSGQTLPAPNAVLLVSVAAWLVLTPALGLPWPFGDYDGKRVLELAILALMATLLAASRSLRADLAAMVFGLPATIALGLVALALLGVASAVRADYPVYAFAELGLLAGTCLLSMTLAAAARPLAARLTHYLAVLLMGLMGLYLLRVLAAYLAARTGGAPLYVPELYAGFGHLRFFSQMQTWTLPLCVLPFLVFRSVGWRALGMLFAVGWWMLNFGTGTRGTMLAMGVALPAAAILCKRGAWRWALAQLICIAAGLLLAWIAFVLPETIGDEFGPGRYAGTYRAEQTANIRITFLLQGWALIQAQPWLGVGPMHFAAAGAAAAHPHNSLVQIVSEWGVPFSCLAVLFGGGGFWTWLTHGSKAASQTTGDVPHPDPLVAFALRPALTGAVIGAAIHALVSGLLVTPTSQMWLAVTGALLLLSAAVPARGMASAGSRPHAAQAWPDAGHAPRHLGFAMLALALMTVACWLPAVRQDLALSADTMRLSTVCGRRLQPRFWQHGFIDEQRDLRALDACARLRADGLPVPAW